MIVYLKQKFAFQHINRCGGVSVRTTLRELAGKPDYIPDQGAAHQPMKTRLHVLNKVKVPTGRLKIYANVRNPFDRLASIYRYRIKTGIISPDTTFEDFFYHDYVKSDKLANWPMQTYLFNGRKLPDNLTIIKFENINREWPKILKAHFGKDVALKHVNKTRPALNDCTFDQEMRTIVKKIDWWVISNFYPEEEH